MFCENCGKQLVDGSKFCDGCGSKTAGQDAAPVAAVGVNSSYGMPQNAIPPQPATFQSTSPNPAAPNPVPPNPAQFGAVPPQPQNFNRQQYPNNTYQSNNAQRLENAPPLSVGEYIVTFILFGIPIVNIILLLVWGFGSGVNPNKKNLAKAMLIMLVIMIALWIIVGASMASILTRMFRNM